VPPKWTPYLQFFQRSNGLQVQTCERKNIIQKQQGGKTSPAVSRKCLSKCTLITVKKIFTTTLPKLRLFPIVNSRTYLYLLPYITTSHVCSVAEQKERNDGAKKEIAALRDQVLRMGPVLNPLTSARGLDRARLVLDNLGASLGQAKHIYEKYQGGWNIKKCWVTPGKILEKTLRTKAQISEAYQELTVALGIESHVKGEETTTTIPFEESQKTWEIPFKDLEFSLKKNGIPKEVLGQGSFGIVGLAILDGEQVRFRRI